MTYELNSETAERTGEIGYALGQLFRERPAVLLLFGNLGVGKTTLSQAIARGLGLQDQVTSPTYTLMNVYGGGALIHFDLYRLQEEDELFEIGFEDVVDQSVPIIIEWPELVSEYPFSCCMKLRIDYGTLPCLRKLTFETDDRNLMEGLKRLVKEK